MSYEKSRTEGVVAYILLGLILDNLGLMLIIACSKRVIVGPTLVQRLLWHLVNASSDKQNNDILW